MCVLGEGGGGVGEVYLYILFYSQFPYFIL